jgi:DNA-binding beta-propeller fold protein YncE
MNAWALLLESPKSHVAPVEQTGATIRQAGRFGLARIRVTALIMARRICMCNSKTIVAALTVLVCVFASLASAGPIPAQLGQLFITDSNGIERYDFQTAQTTNLVAESAGAIGFTGIAIGPDGNLYASTQTPGQVIEYNPATGAQIGSGPFVFYEGTPPTPDPHDVNGPEGMDFSPTNANLYIADVTVSNVHRYDTAGNSVISLTAPSLVQPTDVAFDAGGNLYVGSTGTAEILKSAGGTQPLSVFVSTQSGGLNDPGALTFGPDGMLYVLDVSNSKIFRYASDGTFDKVFADLGLFQPNDLAFGPDGKLYVAGIDLSLAQSEVIRLTAAGADDGVVVSSGLDNPQFIAFASVPEPSSLGLLASGGLLIWRRRRT